MLYRYLNKQIRKIPAAPLTTTRLGDWGFHNSVQSINNRYLALRTVVVRTDASSTNQTRYQVVFYDLLNRAEVTRSQLETYSNVNSVAPSVTMAFDSQFRLNENRYADVPNNSSGGFYNYSWKSYGEISNPLVGTFTQPNAQGYYYHPDAVNGPDGGDYSVRIRSWTTGSSVPTIVEKVSHGVVTEVGQNIPNMSSITTTRYLPLAFLSTTRAAMITAGQVHILDVTTTPWSLLSTTDIGFSQTQHNNGIMLCALSSDRLVVSWNSYTANDSFVRYFAASDSGVTELPVTGGVPRSIAATGRASNSTKPWIVPLVGSNKDHMLVIGNPGYTTTNTDASRMGIYKVSRNQLEYFPSKTDVRAGFSQRGFWGATPNGDIYRHDQGGATANGAVITFYSFSQVI